MILFIIIVISLIAPLISPYDPAATDVLHRAAKPSAEHLLGTDSFGRDMYSRLLWGGRITLLVGLLVQLAGSLRGDRLIFPGVGQILAVFFRLLGEAGTWQKILVTLLHLAEALALSALLTATSVTMPRTFSMKASRPMVSVSPVSRLRTLTVPSSASLGPRISM